MPGQSWTFSASGRLHTVTVQPGADDPRITLDDKPVHAESKLSKSGMAYGFRLKSHRLVLRPRASGNYTLLLDGEPVRTASARTVSAEPISAVSPAQDGAIFSRHSDEVAAKRQRMLSMREYVPDWTWLFILALMALIPIGYLHALAFTLFGAGTIIVLAVANWDALTTQQQIYVSWFVTMLFWATYILLGMRSVVPCRIAF